MTYLPKAPEPLDATEWKYLKDCTDVLQPLYTMTEEMSGAEYPTESIVLPLLRTSVL